MVYPRYGKCARFLARIHCRSLCINVDIFNWSGIGEMDIINLWEYQFSMITIKLLIICHWSIDLEFHFDNKLFRFDIFSLFWIQLNRYYTVIITNASFLRLKNLKKKVLKGLATEWANLPCILHGAITL